MRGWYRIIYRDSRAFYTDHLGILVNGLRLASLSLSLSIYIYLSILRGVDWGLDAAGRSLAEEATQKNLP